MDLNEARQIMLKFYFYTEKQYKEFIDIIPLGNSATTHSPILYNVLQSSCGQIENLMRLLCDKFQLSYSEKNFPIYYKLLNEDGVLERQHITLSKNSGVLIPFQLEPNFMTPKWWRGYNETKHDLPDGLRAGNLGNVTNALGALYALHCFAYYAYLTSSSNILKKSFWYEKDFLFLDSDMRMSREELDHRPKSEIFYCLSYFNEEGLPF